MNEMTSSLSALGDALERAARANLRLAEKPTPAVRRRRRRRRHALLGVAVAILVPGAAVAATHLLSTTDVAQSLPAGTLWLAGTEPSCTVVHDGVEYHCTLAKAPREASAAPAPLDWKGTVEPTVDKSKRVNGGCRSLASDGRDWECYVGQAAVDQKIISAGFLGQTVSGPGVG